MKRCKHPPIVHIIGAAAFCDNGAMIEHDDIATALDADRGAGFQDPTRQEVLLLVQGGDPDGQPPPDLCAKHSALDVLLTRECS